MVLDRGSIYKLVSRPDRRIITPHISPILTAAKTGRMPEAIANGRAAATRVDGTGEGDVDVHIRLWAAAIGLPVTVKLLVGRAAHVGEGL